MARVALVASSFLPRVGGVEEHVANVAVELRDRGHEVVVWAADRGDVPLRDHRGIRVRYLPCPLPTRSVSGVARFGAALPAARRVWTRALREDAPEVLHVQCFGPNGVYAEWLARRRRLPLVYSHHGETFGDADGAFDVSALLRDRLARTLRRADAVTSVSAWAAGDLERFGFPPDRVRVVYNGVDPDEPVGPPPPGLPERYVLGVGRLAGNKGFDVLVRAFARVAGEPELHGVGLVIGGDGPEAGSLHRLAAASGIADRVEMPGMLARPEVGGAMRSAALLVVPSRVEAFGIAVLEGWRAGIPVLATTHGGPPEFTRDGVDAVLIDPDDEAAVADALRRVLADPAFAGALGRAGGARVGDFSWGAVARAYSAIYDDALSARRS
ncbi:glycosyltransferase family 4 protein [Agromyces sp. NPDC055661]